MFHEKKTSRDFFYFACSLAEVNEDFADVKFVGGDRDRALKAFLRFLHSSTFLPCTKHVIDDIRRELTEVLGLASFANQYIEDIFGSPSKKLID